MDGFSFELIFAWIDFPGIAFCVHLFSWIASFGGCAWLYFCFIYGWYLLCNDLELEDTFYFFGTLFVKAKFFGEASLRNKFTGASIFTNWWILKFYVDLILLISGSLANKLAQNINPHKNWSTQKLIQHLSSSRSTGISSNLFLLKDTHCV